MLGRLRSALRDSAVRSAIVYSACFAALGLAVSAVGSILPDLKAKSGSEAELGVLFTARSLGYLGGSIASGPLLDKLSRRGNQLIGGAVLLTAVGNGVLPLLSRLWLLCFAMASTGLAMGLLDAAANVLIIWAFQAQQQRSVEPYLQAMHASFAIAAFVAPLFVHAMRRVDGGGFALAYWIMAGSFVPLGVLCLLMPTAERRSEEVQGAAQTRSSYVVVGCCAVFLGLYVGAEVSCGGYIYSYALEHLRLSDTLAALSNSVFWGCLALGRIVAVSISTRVKSELLIMGSLALCVVGLAPMALFPQSAGALFVGAALFGLGMAPCFPTVFTWVEEVLPLFTAKMGTLLVVGASMGEMALPALLSVLFVAVGYEALFPFLLLFVVMSVLMMLVAFEVAFRFPAGAVAEDDSTLLEAAAEAELASDGEKDALGL